MLADTNKLTIFDFGEKYSIPIWIYRTDLLFNARSHKIARSFAEMLRRFLISYYKEKRNQKVRKEGRKKESSVVRCKQKQCSMFKKKFQYIHNIKDLIT
jgi:hypothetical protein